MAADAAGEQRSSEDLEFSFSLRKEQRTALKSFLKKGRCVGSLKFNLSASSATFFVALVGCNAILLVQREFERQLFIPPLGLSPDQWGVPRPQHLDVGLAGQASSSNET